MSTATALPARGMPTPVSNLVTAWWLAIGFGIAAALLMWPDLPWGKLAVLGYVLLAVGAGVLLVLGAWVANGLHKGNPSALARCRLLSLVGTIGGIALLVGYIAFKSSQSTENADPALSYTGATNIFLVGSLLAAIVLPPLLFSLFAWSLSMQDEVERFYYPPAQEETNAVVEPVIAQEVATSESEAVVMDADSIGTLMSEQAAMEEALAAHEEALTATAEGGEDELATPTAEPFDTGSVQIEGESTDPFATTSATGKRLNKLAAEAQRLDPDAIEHADLVAEEAEAVEASEVLSATEVSASVSADIAEDPSESVLLADEDASALLASDVEEKPKAETKLPPIPSNMDEPLSVGDMELTFDDSPPKEPK